jgi:hypothetical protein
MKYIGNYQFDGLRELAIMHVGSRRPRDIPHKESWDGYTAASKAGHYDLNAVYWEIVEQGQIDTDLKFPWTNSNTHWWISKMTPGQFMPMHVDPIAEKRKCNRYWIPLQDYEPGHIFIYDTELIKDYVAGDVYQFNDSDGYHGAANIGHSVRLVLQVNEYFD